jgi:hypothetical protein
MAEPMSDKRLERLTALAELPCSCDNADCQNYMSALTAQQAQELAAETQQLREQLAAANGRAEKAERAIAIEKARCASAEKLMAADQQRAEEAWAAMATLRKLQAVWDRDHDQAMAATEAHADTVANELRARLGDAKTEQGIRWPNGTDEQWCGYSTLSIMAVAADQGGQYIERTAYRGPWRALGGIVAGLGSGPDCGEHATPAPDQPEATADGPTEAHPTKGETRDQI